MYTVHAPELEPALAWINTQGPLRMRALRGHVVILDFWTSCCINCMHVLPVLAALERRFAHDPVVVIGVHSAKFAAEAEPARVAEAVARYGVTHPVVVDDAMGIWERYAVRSWPTLVVVRPDGHVAAVAPGEPEPSMLAALVDELLTEARAAGTLAAERIDVSDVPSSPTKALRFVGGLDVSPDGRIAIADTGHHRVLITDAEGVVLTAVGTGHAGLADGDLRFARFRSPQSVAWDGALLWVADTGNHCVRVIDLDDGVVTRVAGTGEMGAVVLREPVAARNCPLRSPWDLVVDDTQLIVSMAGSHQLWRYDRETGMIGPWSGSGREALIDGSQHGAAYAQPSGLSRAGNVLYVADSETSAVRAVSIDDASVRTLTGAGLFDFGNLDGARGEARMQHPIGVVAMSEGTVLVADTYNDRIRRIDVASGEVSTWYVGDDERALRDPEAIVALPEALGGGALIADTGNHRIVVLDPHGAWVRTLDVQGAPAPELTDPDALDTELLGERAPTAAGFFTAAVHAEGARALGVGVAHLRFEATLPEGWCFAAEAPVSLRLEISRRGDLWALAQDALRCDAGGEARVTFTLEVTVDALPAEVVESELLAVLDAMLCNDDVCAPTRQWFRVPITLQREGAVALAFVLPVAGATL
jgi:thiol-disulfide isomerase/thioredoxin